MKLFCSINVLVVFLVFQNEQVHCQNCRGHNVALNQETRQSSTFSDNHVVHGSNKAIDGVLGTSTDFNHCTQTDSKDDNPWFEITFPSSNIFTIVIYNRVDCCQDRLSYFKLELYDANTKINVTQGPDMSHKDNFTIDYSPSIKATKARISPTYKSNDEYKPILGICELEIFVEDVNVALNRKTSQSSTYLNYGPEKAVDGNTDSNMYEDHCSHTGREDRNPWFEVTFPKSNIRTIKIYNRVDCCQVRLQGFKLQLHNGDRLVHTYIDTEVNPKDIYTIECLHSEAATKALISRSHIAPVDTNPFVEICEIEIFGDIIECDAGFYGDECFDPCSSHCSTCDRETGSCTCKPGYIETNCDQECPSGYFGINCTNRCSSHCTSSTCNNVDGHCTCKLGYTGDTCNQACPLGYFGANCTLITCTYIDGICTFTSCSTGGACVQDDTVFIKELNLMNAIAIVSQ